MTQTLEFRKLMGFSVLSSDSSVKNVSVDWSGSPLILLEVGKPPKPPPDAPIDTRRAWRDLGPKYHTLVYWEDDKQKSLPFADSTSHFIWHVQPLESGWLLGEARGGRSTVYDCRGEQLRMLDLGDASQDIQTTRGGKIWVSYFDEGVFGGGIGQGGLVCFSTMGEVLFSYAEFARSKGLPEIDDCYSMNVVDDDDVWINYYSDFPLVRLDGFELHTVWRDQVKATGAGFAVRGDRIIYAPLGARGTLAVWSTVSGQVSSGCKPTDTNGNSLHFSSMVGRKDRLYGCTETALYELT